ncbi:MAG TPA: hypothetical protein VGO40_07565 [Longimicrobium sp.]|jgi:hypothetical protein|nr:hypothetical protein [Longimicrobium sp.]
MGSAAERLDRVRTELEKRFGAAIRPLPGAAPAPGRDGFRVGVRALDQLLPGGVPRGAVTLWTGEATAGRTAAVRALVERARRHALVAVVDATLTLDPAAWCGEDGGSPPGVWVARPPAPGHEEEGAWVAESLLRTGAFGLVVLDGPLPDATAVHRLRALARETGAALLVSAGGGAAWRADVRLEFRRAPGAEPGLGTGARFRGRAGVRLAKDAGARTGEREVELVHEPTSRLPLHFAPDRRAAARR